MNIEEILEETVEMDTEWKGKKITFHAAVEVLTPEFLETVNEPALYHKAVASAVRKWDVTDAKKKMWPLDEASLKRLPIPFLSKVLDRIGESFEGEKKSEAS